MNFGKPQHACCQHVEQAEHQGEVQVLEGSDGLPRKLVQH